MGTGQSIFGGDEEEGRGSGGIVQRGDDRREGGNAPGNDDGPVIRAGVQSSNLTL